MAGTLTHEQAMAALSHHAYSSPEALEKAWPIYQNCARRKQFRLERPLSVYQEAMRLAANKLPLRTRFVQRPAGIKNAPAHSETGSEAAQ